MDAESVLQADWESRICEALRVALTAKLSQSKSWRLFSISPRGAEQAVGTGSVDDCPGLHECDPMAQSVG